MKYLYIVPVVGVPRWFRMIKKMTDKYLSLLQEGVGGFVETYDRKKLLKNGSSKSAEWMIIKAFLGYATTKVWVNDDRSGLDTNPIYNDCPICVEDIYGDIVIDVTALTLAKVTEKIAGLMPPALQPLNFIVPSPPDAPAEVLVQPPAEEDPFLTATIINPVPFITARRALLRQKMNEAAEAAKEALAASNKAAEAYSAAYDELMKELE